MSRMKKIVIGAILAAVLLVGGFFAFMAFRPEGPAELVIGERATTTTQSPDTTLAVEDPAEDPPETVATTTTTTAAPAPARDGIEGAWTVSGDSLAGYRVVEDFVGGISDFEAVGRTSEIEGSLTIEGTTVTEASFSIDVATITSDDSFRDNQFRGPIMSSEEFPTGDFTLTSPIELGSEPAEGEQVTVDATGELTLRGVTNPVTFPITARLVGGEIETAGSIDVSFADYNITNPSFAAITVRSEGVVEFSLIFIPS